MMRWLLGIALVLAVAQPVRAGADVVPDCATIDGAAEGPASDCRTVSSDRVGLTFEGRTTETAPRSYRTAVSVLSPDGAREQVITEDTARDYAPRFLLRDLDDDGRDEVLVVTDSGGTGGDTMAVWRSTGESMTFTRAGEVFGFPRFWTTADGFTGQYAHSGAGAGVIGLMEFVGERLVTVAVLDVQTLNWADKPPRDDWQVNGDTKCALNNVDAPPGSLAKRDAALRAHGIDPATAGRRFCSEPWADYYR